MDYLKYTPKQLLKSIRYERQFAGIPGCSYHPGHIRDLIKELRSRQGAA